jgi:signal transduction histidine kinase
VGHRLGQSINHDIVYGGTITADSEVDGYTEFTINLPRRMFATDRRRA